MTMTGMQEQIRQPGMNPVAGRDSEELEQAFREFSSLSEKLTESYRELEQRVASLSGELADVSAQRMQELAERERIADRLENLLDLLPGGIVVLDGQGRVQDCNPAALELLGEPLKGEIWLEIIDRSFSPRGDDGHEVSLRDGRRVSIATRSLGNTPGQIILLTDQTETRQLQEAVSRQERLAAMGRMVASLAHEIRTPLSAAMIYSSHLCKPDLGEQQRIRFAEKARARLEHLEQQVRDMLLFARGESVLGDLVDVDELIEGVMSVVEPTATNADATLVLRNRIMDAKVLCSRDALTGAIVNLVNNAVEAGGAGSWVQIATRLDDEEQLQIMVSDSGPGIAPEEIERVFEPFYTTKASGNGLGLAIVQAIARSHNGDFTLQSSPGKGTRARLTLPVHREVTEHA